MARGHVGKRRGRSTQGSAKVQIGAELLCKGERDGGRGVRPARPRYNKDSTRCPYGKTADAMSSHPYLRCSRATFATKSVRGTKRAARRSGQKDYRVAPAMIPVMITRIKKAIGTQRGNGAFITFPVMR